MSDKKGDASDESYIGSEEETVRGDPSPFFAPPDALIGTDVGGYLVKGRLGSGGMGIVYEGEQTVIGKRVAIKVLKGEVAGNPDVVRRLIAEARAVNSVGHRNIIDVFGFADLPDGRQAIIMELLEGESLEQLLAQYHAEHRTMPVGEVLVVLDELLSGLAAAHAAGVIHRDLKPSNVFLCRQRDGSRYVKILDFGIAKLGVLGDAAHNASVLVGTPAYMAPEQATGGVVSPALDLYAVGVMAFELLTGRLPFIAESLFQLITKHAQERPPLPSSLNMGLPDALDDLVMKLLEKRPEDRYPSANAVRSEVVALKKQLAAPSAFKAPLPPAQVRQPPPAPVAAAATKPGDETLPSRAPNYSLSDDEGDEDTVPRGARPPPVSLDDDDGTENTLPSARRRDLEQQSASIASGPRPEKDPKALVPTAEIRRVPRPDVAKAPPRKPGLPLAVWLLLLAAAVALVVVGVLAFLRPPQ